MCGKICLFDHAYICTLRYKYCTPMTERMVQIPVERYVRDRIKELKIGESYSQYLIKLTKLSKGQDLHSQPSDEPLVGGSNE